MSSRRACGTEVSRSSAGSGPRFPGANLRWGRASPSPHGRLPVCSRATSTQATGTGDFSTWTPSLAALRGRPAGAAVLVRPGRGHKDESAPRTWSQPCVPLCGGCHHGEPCVSCWPARVHRPHRPLGALARSRCSVLSPGLHRCGLLHTAARTGQWSGQTLKLPGT